MTATIIAITTDLIAITLLAVALYHRRHHRRDLMFAYVTLNVGVLAVATVLGSAQAGIGLGLGLFGVLSIIRLRSDPISQAEIAYYFCALALGLIGGLAVGAWWVTPAFSVLLLIVVYLADHPRIARGVRSMTLTLDVAILDRERLQSHVAGTLGAAVVRMDVHEVDLVRDVTILEVWYAPHADAAPTRSEAEVVRSTHPRVSASLVGQPVS